MYLHCSFLFVFNVRFNVGADNNVTSKNINFVDVLKQNLKQNNDDYAEMEKTKLFTSTITRTDFGKNKIMKNGVHRRAADGHTWEFDFNELTEPSSANTNNSDNLPVAIPDALRMRSTNKLQIKNFFHVKRNISRLNEIKPYSNLLKNNTIDLHSKLPKVINKKRIDEFKKFMSKNKDLLNVFLSSKFETQTNKVKVDDHKTEHNELGIRVLRNEKPDRARTKDEEEGKLPGPEMLDMAPAKGGRIHRLRVKGRLCQRHVLMPEGPKYDSNGRWYVPEHRLVARHLYDVTPRPRLLLPRCCNCCKKSVLGCE